MNEQLAKFQVMADNTRRANEQARRRFESCMKAASVECPTCGHPLCFSFDALVRCYLSDKNYHGPIPFGNCRECEMRAHLRNRGVPEKLLRCSFSNWKLESTSDRVAHSEAHSFCRQFEQTPVAARKHTLFFSSRVNGTGKSHLATAIMRHWVSSHSRPSYFVSQLQIGAMVADTYRSDYVADPKRRYGSVPFVVLDDLGQDSGRRDELAAVEAILTERDARCGWTVITTNLEQGAFAKWIGPRVTDRLMESIFAWVTMGNVSRRIA